MSKSSKGDTRTDVQEESGSSSTHRPSLFLPPESPRQMAMAEAGVAALSNFTVPSAYDTTLVNQPDGQSVLVHALSSSHKDMGWQAVIVLHPKTVTPPHLGLPVASNGVRLEETAFLMTSLPNEPFIRYDQAPKATTMQISVTEYLTLLSFFVKDWSRLRSKLESQTDKMRENRDPVIISPCLSFYSHGCSLYSTALSPRLVLKIKADSKKPTKNDQFLTGWLEQRVSNQWQELGLALPALTALGQNTHTVKTLTDLVTQYKNGLRKRSTPVK